MDDTIPQDDIQKQCNRCKQFFPSTMQYFYSHKNRKDGLSTFCKDCVRASEREHRLNPPVPEGYKKCPKCGEIKPSTPDFFNRSRDRKDGLQSHCKYCTKRRGKDKEVIPLGHKRCTKCKEIKPLTREFYHATVKNPNKWTERCKVCRNAEHRAMYYRDIIQPRPAPEILPEGYKRCTKCRQVFPENLAFFRFCREGKNHLRSCCLYCDKSSAATYSLINVERLRLKARTYNAAHPEKVKEHNQNRRARKKSVGGTFTKEQIRDQYLRQKKKCYYCRKYIKWGKHQIEHTFPLSRVAGTDIPANDISYLVIACRTCNLKKGSKFPWEWAEGNRLL